MDIRDKYLLLDSSIYLKLKLLKQYKNSKIKRVNLKQKLNTREEFHKYFQRLLNDPDDFYEQIKMKPDTFFYILNHVRSNLLLKGNHPEFIPPEEKLFITLRYLSCGGSFRTMISPFALNGNDPVIIFNETCDSIWSELVHLHMPFPTEESFKKIAQQFESSYNFPNCVGCIDCKYLRVKNSNVSGIPTYLQVIVDPSNKFLCAEVISDEHNQIFYSSKAFNCIETKRFKIPPAIKIENLKHHLPYVFLGGRGYPLKQYLLRPYKIRNSSRKEDDELFNNKLNDARRPVECALTLLMAKWKILNSELHSDHLDKIVKLSCLLHNITIDKEGLDVRILSDLKKFHTSVGLVGYSRLNSPERAAIVVRSLFKQLIKNRCPKECTSIT